jgi:FkbM family methyltransferase
MSFNLWYIKLCRYLLQKKFLPVMSGHLKGYLWTTQSSYEYLTGEYEDPDVIQTFISWCKPSSVLYDLGGNVGFYALLANRFITEGKIYSFEPVPYNRAVFERHLALNKKHILHDNIRILPFAISDHEKLEEFSNDQKHLDGNTYIKSSSVFIHAAEKIPVACYSIDELVMQGFEAPGILKIDVEGAELDVLNGALKTLNKYRPNILLATHDCHLPGVKDSCVRLLQELGYSVRHTGRYNKQLPGLDDFIAVHSGKSFIPEQQS